MTCWIKLCLSGLKGIMQSAPCSHKKILFQQWSCLELSVANGSGLKKEGQWTPPLLFKGAKIQAFQWENVNFTKKINSCSYFLGWSLDLVKLTFVSFTFIVTWGKGYCLYKLILAYKYSYTVYVSCHIISIQCLIVCSILSSHISYHIVLNQ